jgi:hypothetical protein
MDNQNLALEIVTRQDFRCDVHRTDLNHDEPPLNPEDRRLLLGASLRLLGNRFTCGKKILQEDVIRIASFADEAMESAA